MSQKLLVSKSKLDNTLNEYDKVYSSALTWHGRMEKENNDVIAADCGQAFVTYGDVTSSFMKKDLSDFIGHVNIMKCALTESLSKTNALIARSEDFANVLRGEGAMDSDSYASCSSSGDLATFYDDHCPEEAGYEGNISKNTQNVLDLGVKEEEELVSIENELLSLKTVSVSVGGQAAHIRNCIQKQNYTDPLFNSLKSYGTDVRLLNNYVTSMNASYFPPSVGLRTHVRSYNYSGAPTGDKQSIYECLLNQKGYSIEDVKALEQYLGLSAYGVFQKMNSLSAPQASKLVTAAYAAKKNTGADEGQGAKLDPSEYADKYAELSKYMDQLEDGNPDNDTEAIKNINSLLKNCLYIKEEDDKRTLEYDTDFIDYCLKNSAESSLLHGLFTDLMDNATELGTITELNGWKSNPSYSLNISQLRAGYQLQLSADSTIGWGSEVKKERVAYAATDNTAKNYLGSEGNWNWDNISVWLKSEVIDWSSEEYFYFAREMQEMTDEELEKVIDYAQIRNITISGVYYKMSDVLPLIADYYLLEVNAQKQLTDYYDNDYEKYATQEARAIAFAQAVSYMPNGGARKCNVDFSTMEGIDGTVHTAKVTFEGLNISDPAVGLWDAAKHSRDLAITITVNPRSSDRAMSKDLNDGVKGVLLANVSPFYTGVLTEEDRYDLALKVGKYVKSKVLGLATSEVDPLGLGQDVMDFAEEVQEAYNQSKRALGAVDAANMGEAAMSMAISGRVVNIDGKQGYTSYVLDETYDENALAVRAAAFSKFSGDVVTTDELKESYNENGEVYIAYNDWYFSEHGKDDLEQYEKEVEEALKIVKQTTDDVNIEDATLEEVEKAIDIIQHG